MLSVASKMFCNLPRLSLLALVINGIDGLVGPGLAVAQDKSSVMSLPAVPVKQIVVQDIQFSGNQVLSSTELKEVVAGYMGKTLSYTELEELRARITRLYVARGYLNSGAVLAVAEGVEPFPGGIVTVRLIEGRISEVRIKGEGRLMQSYIRDRLVNEAEVFNMPVLQRRFQLLLTDPLFDKINSRILPGEQPGTAVLDIDVQRAPSSGLNLYANNYRAASIGSDVLGVSGWVRNLSGLGDMLEANFSHSEGADPMHLGWNLPLNSIGTSLRLSADHGSSAVIDESLKSVDIKSRSSGYELGLTQALLNSLQRKIEIGVSYGQRDSQTSLLGEAFSFTPGEPDGYSRTRVLRLSQEWTERWETQALALRSVFTFGRNNLDQSDSAAPARQYRIWTGQLQYVNNLDKDGRQIVLRASTQQSPDRLMPLERFSLGGVTSVRGYRENALVRDRAYMLNAEFHYPLNLGQDGGHKIRLIALTDLASASNVGEASQSLASIGAGLNWQWKNWAADLILAKKLKTIDGAGAVTGSNLQDQGVHLQLSYRVF